MTDGLVDIARGLGLGLSVAFAVKNVLLCFVGSVIGMVMAVMTGIGPVAAIALLLPFTFGFDPVGGLILLVAIFCGAQHAGSTTALLAAARPDGFAAALGLSALATLVAGLTAVLVVALLVKPVSAFAGGLGRAEYFALLVLVLAAAVVVWREPVWRSLVMIGCGLGLSRIGGDVAPAPPGGAFGWAEAATGFEFAVVVVGVLGFAACMNRAGGVVSASRVLNGGGSRRSTDGAMLGAIPGQMLDGPRPPGTMTRTGRTAFEGTLARSALLPLLALSIPASAAMALMAGALYFHGIVPGPQIVVKQPQLFWGTVVSIALGAVLLPVIDVALVRLRPLLARTPFGLVLPAFVLLGCIGIYSIDSSAYQVLAAAGFGVVGVALMHWGFKPALLVVGYAAGRPVVEAFRQATLEGEGGAGSVVMQPLAGVVLVGALLLLGAAQVAQLRGVRDDGSTVG